MMAENPDHKAPVAEAMVPSNGDLRFVLRDVEDDSTPMPRQLRILQRYEWSITDGQWAWYDVHLAEESDDGV